MDLSSKLRGGESIIKKLLLALIGLTGGEINEEVVEPSKRE
jgi:hypothetical protein